MDNIICGVDNKECNILMCKKCNKYDKKTIEGALKRKESEYLKIKSEYLKIKQEFKNFYDNVNRKYIPSCKYGYDDCVYDEEYIKVHHPDWYSTLKNDEEILTCDVCEDGSEYDDEDK